MSQKDMQSRRAPTEHTALLDDARDTVARAHDDDDDDADARGGGDDKSCLAPGGFGEWRCCSNQRCARVWAPLSLPR
jgi:hypothetical protein